MRVLVCRQGGVWMFSGADRQPAALPCPLECPCAPCAAQGISAFACSKSRETLCLETGSGREISRMPCVPGVCAMCFSPCGRYLYQLGSDADSVHTRSTATGELLYAAPAGVFPRSMKMAAGGGLLLCAGGAAPEALLMNTPDLTTSRRIAAKHPCFAADFWQDGLALVCAAEGHDIQTILYTLSHRGVRPRKLLELSGLPGALCTCPDGKSALLSTRDGLMKVDLSSGTIAWNCPEWALCMRIECRGEKALISDTLDGSVCLFNHHRPWARSVIAVGTETQACFV